MFQNNATEDEIGAGEACRASGCHYRPDRENTAKSAEDAKSE